MLPAFFKILNFRNLCKPWFDYSYTGVGYALRGLQALIYVFFSEKRVAFGMAVVDIS